MCAVAPLCAVATSGCPNVFGKLAVVKICSLGETDDVRDPVARAHIWAMDGFLDRSLPSVLAVLVERSTLLLPSSLSSLPSLSLEGEKGGPLPHVLEM